MDLKNCAKRKILCISDYENKPYTMQIEKIIYDTTRGILNVEDKLRIATIFLFCEKLSSKTFAELLYTDDHKGFIQELESSFSKFDIDLSIRLPDKNIRECFNKTLDKVKEKYDDNGYYKALFENDPFALVIDDIVSYDFNAIEFIKKAKIAARQLEMFK